SSGFPGLRSPLFQLRSPTPSWFNFGLGSKQPLPSLCLREKLEVQILSRLFLETSGVAQVAQKSVNSCPVNITVSSILCPDDQSALPPHPSLLQSPAHHSLFVAQR